MAADAQASPTPHRFWRILAAAPGTFCAMPAFAEVCDKVRPNWNPADGPVNQLEDLFLFVTTPIVMPILALAAMALITRKRSLAVIAVLTLSLLVVLNSADWFWVGDPVNRFANSEGCITPPILTNVALLAFSAYLYWRVIRRRNSNNP